MTLFVTALAGLVFLAFFIASASALVIGHLERMADIARSEVDV